MIPTSLVLSPSASRYHRSSSVSLEQREPPSKIALEEVFHIFGGKPNRRDLRAAYLAAHRKPCYDPAL